MKKQISLLFVFILLLTGCSKQPLKDSFFKTANTLDSYKMIQSQETKGISNDLAVIEKDDITPTTFQATAKGMLLVNETKNEYLVANVYKREADYASFNESFGFLSRGAR